MLKTLNLGYIYRYMYDITQKIEKYTRNFIYKIKDFRAHEVYTERSFTKS